MNDEKNCPMTNSPILNVLRSILTPLTTSCHMSCHMIHCPSPRWLCQPYWLKSYPWISILKSIHNMLKSHNNSTSFSLKKTNSFPGRIYKKNKSIILRKTNKNKYLCPSWMWDVIPQSWEKKCQLKNSKWQHSNLG